MTEVAVAAPVDSLKIRPSSPDRQPQTEQTSNPGLRKGLTVAGAAVGLLTAGAMYAESRGYPVISNLLDLIRPAIDVNNIPTPEPGPPPFPPGK